MRIHRTHRPSSAFCAITIAILGIALPTALTAQVVQIDETIALDPQGDVSVEVVSHGVVLEAWDRAEIQVVGEYDSAIEELEIESSSGAFDLEVSFVDSERRGRPEGSRELIVRLPVGASVSVESVSGGVGLTRAPGVSGGSELVALESVSGSIVVESDASVVMAASVSGSIRLSAAADEVAAETVSGRIQVEGNVPRVESETVSGRISVTTGTPVQDLSLESVSGSLDFDGALAPGGRFEVETFSGSVEMTLSETPDAEFQLETFSGSIDWNLAGATDEIIRENRFVPGESVSFRVGAGSGTVEVSTHSGSIAIDGP